jgi:hypothetical protein
MSIVADLKMYWRFAKGLRSFLRHSISLDEAREIVRQRMAAREKNFLRLVERGIFGNRRSPYLPLLKLAGCELGDIQGMVHSTGLEKTLHELREAGVYITFEEFKGRTPIVRQGRVIPVQVHDFDNPYLSHYYQVETGGTTGAGTRVQIDLDHLAALAPIHMLGNEAHGVLDTPRVIWLGLLPDSSGVNNILAYARLGQVFEKWFSPIVSQDIRPALKYRLATRYIVAAGRIFGVSIPSPELVRMDEAAVVARAMAEIVKTRGGCMIRTHVGMAVRVCIAAREEGLDIAGATFIGGGEPPSPAKVREIIGSGARYVPNYFFTEAGLAGIGCARPVDLNDIHFFKDILALIQYPRQIPGADITVDAFYFTTLLPTAPILMLNVESDDYGMIETRSCGCSLESYGFTEHLRDIRSFGKLTSEGVTLVGSEMVRILEEVLPAKFGGSSLDYQLIEEENEKGLSRVSLIISPKIQITDETAVIEAVLDALGRSSVAADLARAHWIQAGTLRVKRMEPVWTARGKLMPFRPARAQRAADASTGTAPSSGNKPQTKNA